MTSKNRYTQLIEQVFFSARKGGADEVEFQREDIERAANSLGLKLPKNIGDIIYGFRYRTPLPESIKELAPKGKEWVIIPAGRARYRKRITGSGSGPRSITDSCRRTSSIPRTCSAIAA